MLFVFPPLLALRPTKKIPRASSRGILTFTSVRSFIYLRIHTQAYDKQQQNGMAIQRCDEAVQTGRIDNPSSRPGMQTQDRQNYE
ncbi:MULTISPECIES: hypothetical protein [Caballeronia]|uniref:hypothetical protein n=1 Tax=Caballeronia TaxID=1827195 RepID=UPI001FD46C91|nr:MULTISPECIES: hypothetical protein [Caballeronia]MDR5799306.1 hypothetical protein [Caballeronia sp. LZ001]